MKNNKALTLISLVITVIILIILAGVTINLVIGENGLLQRTKTAKEEYNKSQTNEQKKLEELYSSIMIATNDNAEINISVEDLKKLIQEEVKLQLENKYTTTEATTVSSASMEHPAVIIENYSDGTMWYRVWSDGWIEQGGKAIGGASAAGAPVNLLKSYSNTDYTLIATVGSHVRPDSAAWVVVIASKNIDKFNASTSWTNANTTNFDSYNFNWYACGY